MHKACVGASFHTLKRGLDTHRAVWQLTLAAFRFERDPELRSAV